MALTKLQQVTRKIRVKHGLREMLAGKQPGPSLDMGADYPMAEGGGIDSMDEEDSGDDGGFDFGSFDSTDDGGSSDIGVDDSAGTTWTDNGDGTWTDDEGNTVDAEGNAVPQGGGGDDGTEVSPNGQSGAGVRTNSGGSNTGMGGPKAPSGGGGKAPTPPRAPNYGNAKPNPRGTSPANIFIIGDRPNSGINLGVPVYNQNPRGVSQNPNRGNLFNSNGPRSAATMGNIGSYQVGPLLLVGAAAALFFAFHH